MQASKSQLIYLIALSMIGFIATDMYLPAFKDMEMALSTGPAQIALSLSVFLAGMAVGQFLWGLASDRYGNKKTLAVGLLVFTLASFGLAFTSNVSELLALRFLQAIGVCAPAVIWQAMIIKRFPAHTGQQLFATIMPLVALSPALAPQLGVVLSHHFGWQSIFITLTGFGLLLLLATFMQPKEAPTKRSSGSVKQDVATLLRTPTYLGNIIMFAFASAAFFAYLTGMPEIMTQLGYSAKDIGLSFIPQTIAFIAGGFAGKGMVNKWGDGRVLKLLLGLFTLSTLMIFVASQATLSSIWPLLAPFCLLAVANGAMYPIVVNRALSSAKQNPATAAGLQNSLQISVSSLASAVVATLATHALPITGLMITVCMLGLWGGYAIANRSATLDNEVAANES